MSLVHELVRPEQRSKAGEDDSLASLDGNGKMGENLRVLVNPLAFQARPKAQ